MSWLQRERPRSTTARINVVMRYLTLIVATVFGFALIPLYLEHIPYTTFGYWLGSGYFLTLLVSIDPGLTIVLQQRVAHHYARHDLAGLNTYISGGLVVSAIISLAIVAVGLTGKGFVPHMLGMESLADRDLLSQTLTYAILGMALSFFSFSVSAVNQGLQSSLGNGSIVLFANIVSPLVSVVMLKRGFGLDAISIPMLLNGLLLASLQLIYLVLRLRSERVRISVSVKHVREVVGTLSLVFVGRTASIIAKNLDVFIVAKMVSAEALVSLVITRKAFEYGRELVNQLVVAVQPTLAHLSASRDDTKTGAVVARLLILSIWALCFLVGAVLTLNGHFVRLWVSEREFLGALPNLLLALTLVFTLIAASLINVGMSFGQFRVISRGMLVQSVVLIFSVVVGTKLFGVYGAILAPTVAVILGPLRIYLRALRSAITFGSDDRRRTVQESVKAVATSSLVSVAILQFTPASWPFFVLLGISYSVMFAVVSFSLSGVLRSEALSGLRSIGTRGLQD